MNIKEFKSLIKECIFEVLKENLSECMNPSCERICHKCKNRFSGTMICPNCGDNQTKYQADEGFDPTSQGPNIPQENPYPAMNAKMRTMEESEEKEDSYLRYKGGWRLGRLDKRRSRQMKNKPTDFVASTGYYDGYNGKKLASPENVRKTIKETEHGRYAQEAGAEQFDPRTFKVTNEQL